MFKDTGLPIEAFSLWLYKLKLDRETATIFYQDSQSPLVLFEVVKLKLVSVQCTEANFRFW